MKIATLANASVIHTLRWVEYFRSRGHQVRVWSLEPGPESLAASSLPRWPLPGFLRYPAALPALRGALDAFAPDLVDAHYVPNYGLLGALARRHPLVVTAWGSDLLVVGPRDPLQATRARFVLRRADAVIADSRNLARAALGLGAPAARVHTVPWGVDLARFRPRGPREPGLVLGTRMHEPVYDVATLIRAMKPVLEERPETHLVLAGTGSLTETLERQARRFLPSGRYRFLGRLDPEELSRWLSRAQIYVSASLSDSTSLSLLEAMASGAVPVVSDLDGNREWVQDGQGARLFRPGDAEDLTRALRGALGDDAWAERARTRNREVVEREADWAANMRRINSLFEALVDGAGTRETTRSRSEPRGAW